MKKNQELKKSSTHNTPVMDKKAAQQGEKREKRAQRTLEEEFPSSVMAVRFARAQASEIRVINAGALQRSSSS